MPSKRRRLRDFGLKSALGALIHLSDYRGRANLVLIADDGRRETTELLTNVGNQYIRRSRMGRPMFSRLFRTSREHAAKKTRHTKVRKFACNLRRPEIPFRTPQE